MRKKAFTAAGFIAVLIVIALVIDACAPLTSSVLRRDVAIVSEETFTRESTGEAGLSARDTSTNTETVLNELSENKLDTFGYADQLPENFSDEVMSGEGFDEVLVAQGGSVVGFVGRGDASETFSQLSDELISKGWLAVESEQKAMGTLVKKDGLYTWLMLACSSVDDRVSVVIQVKKAS